MNQERKAKDIIKDLPKRRTLLEKMTERMIPRAFERPPVASSARLFEYFDIPDPYSPILKKPKKWKTEIGTSALILGENRREVARHAKVPELKPKKKEPAIAPHQFRPQGIPNAAVRQESKPPPPPPPKPNRGEFGRGQKHGLVGKLPMRPDLNPAVSQKADTRTPMSSSMETNRGSPMPTRQFASPKGRGANRMTASSQKSGKPKPVASSSEEIAARTPPVIRREQSQANTGSFRMKRTKITSQSPVEREIATPKAPPSSISESIQKEEAPAVERSIKQHKAPSAMGLDDLFGFGGQEEGRMKMPKRTKKKQ